jgi:hypothetical protein
MPARILNEDWSEYDNRIIRDKRDAKNFSCTEDWEVHYLVRKISRNYSQYSEDAIRKAINSCCQSTSRSHPRKEFVARVMQRLRA